jgi:hypothetical protein
MATDRYSDNHKIIVGGTAGTKEWELQADTIRNSAGSNFYITTENAYFTSNSGATFSCNGTKFSYTDESRIDFYQNLIVNPGADIIMGSGSDIKMSDTSKLYGESLWLVAGQNTSNGLLKITSGGDADFSEPYIYLIQTSNTISINCDQIGINSPEIYLDGDVRSSGIRTITLAVSPASFVPCLDDSTADLTTLTLNGTIKHKHNNEVGSDAEYSYFAATLPYSIPNGASIRSIEMRIQKAGENAFIYPSIRAYDLVGGGSTDFPTSDEYFSMLAAEDTEKTVSDDLFCLDINKTRYSYTLLIKISSTAADSDTVVYIHGLRLTYTTDRLDNNE